MGLQVENVTMRNTGEQRTKLSVMFTDKNMTLHGATAWGQDKVNELGLQQGEKVDLSCTLQPRMFGGEVIYSLQVYKAERKKEGAEQ